MLPKLLQEASWGKTMTTVTDYVTRAVSTISPQAINSHLPWGTSPSHSRVLDLKGEVCKQYHYCVISMINYGYNYDTHS